MSCSRVASWLLWQTQTDSEPLCNVKGRAIYLLLMDDKLLANILAYWKHTDQHRAVSVGEKGQASVAIRSTKEAPRARCVLSSAATKLDLPSACRISKAYELSCHSRHSAFQQRWRGSASLSGVVNQSRGRWQMRQMRYEARDKGPVRRGVKALLFRLCKISCVNPNTRTHLTQPPKRATASA